MIKKCYEKKKLIQYIYISTRSTLTPHGSVPSSRWTCIECEIFSRSDKISCKVFVPLKFSKYSIELFSKFYLQNISKCCSCK